jgi:hypothetical protein
LARALTALADRLGPADAAFLASKLAEWVLSADRPPHFERLAYALTERVSDTDRLTQLRAHGLLAPVRSAALAAFGRQSDYALYPGVAVLAGSAGVSILPPPAFADVWEFVDWAETKRPELDLKSRPRSSD